MTIACPATSGVVSGVIDAVDCNIRVLAHQSYRDLVGPGTTFATVLTAMLTIYIALIGYQLLLGRGQLRLTVLPVSGLKIGLIMAFTQPLGLLVLLVWQVWAFFGAAATAMMIMIRYRLWQPDPVR